MNKFFSSTEVMPKRVGNITDPLEILILGGKVALAFYSYTKNKWMLAGLLVDEHGNTKEMSRDEIKRAEQQITNIVKWKYAK